MVFTTRSEHMLRNLNCFDGGGVGSGTVEVCCYVFDFEIIKAAIEHNFKDTEFENDFNIYVVNFDHLDEPEI